MISFLLASVPVATGASWVTRLGYSKSIVEYQRKVLMQQTEIMQLHQQLAAATASTRGAQAGTGPLPGGGGAGAGAGPSGAADVAVPAKPITVTLYKDKPEALYDADLKLLLSYASDYIDNVTFEAIIRGRRYHVDLYFHELEVVTDGEYRYSFNLLRATDKSAELAVSRSRVPPAPPKEDGE